MINYDKYLNLLGKNHFIIFLFHGVIQKSPYRVRNYINKHLLASDFENLIIKLRKKGNPLGMDEIISNYEKNTDPPPFSYAITFDDGFENNFSVAAPILEKADTPAIFYVSTDIIENKTITWTDQIEYCLEVVDSGKIKLPWEENELSFFDTKSKIALMENLRGYLKKNLDVDPKNIVESFYTKFDLKLLEKSNDPLDKKMDWHQLKKLNDNKLFLVAGHSHKHVSLASLNLADLNYQIDLSLSMLHKKAGIKSIHYAYPEGQKNDYSPEVIDCLKSKGIKCSPSAIDGKNNKETDLFNLKRVFVD